MQDCYAGDIGDYGKFALLRELHGQGLCIGVNWYKTDAITSEKQEDGKYCIPDHLSVYDDLKQGRFVEPSIGEYLDEEERFLALLDLDECFYFGLHPSNIVPLQGWLMRDNEKLMHELHDARTSLQAHLNETPIRCGEDAIILR